MSNAHDKYEHIFWEDQKPYKKINTTFTVLQAKNLLNILSLKYKFSEEDFKKIEELKDWINDR